MIKMSRRTVSFLLGSALFLTACHKDKEKPALSADKTTVNVTKEAVKEYVQVNSNTDWTLSGAQDWVTVKPASGHGNTKVELSFTANTAPTSRTTTLTLSGSNVSNTSISVTQMGAAASLLVDHNTLSVPAEGQQQTIIITSNVPWKLDIPAGATSWITAAEALTGNPGVTTLHFTIASNTTAGAKTANLTLSSTGTVSAPSQTIAITQEQANVVISSFTAHAKGGESIVITGSGFSPSVTENKVKINGVDATVSEASATSLTVTVPAKVGSGLVNVQVGTKTAVSTTDFIYDWIGTVTTFAGKAGVGGYVDGSADAARFSDINGIAVDNNGNIYVPELFKHTIRKITPTGVVTTIAGQAGVAGSDNGNGSAALFRYPTGIAVDNNGNLYVTDQGNFMIRKITPAGDVTTLAGLAGGPGSDDGTGTAARFRNTSGITVDGNGTVYVTDHGNNTIRKITPAGNVTTLAGQVLAAGNANGTGSAASFDNPTGIAVDNNGNLFISDQHNHMIRKITPAGVVTTLAGNAGITGNADGSGTSAFFNNPYGITIENNGSLYVTDQSNQTIRMITPTGIVTTIAGLAGVSGTTDGIGSNARFYYPYGIAKDKNGNIYIGGDHAIRKITLQ